jgi:hypothetical protein
MPFTSWSVSKFINIVNFSVLNAVVMLTVEIGELVILPSVVSLGGNPE